MPEQHSQSTRSSEYRWTRCLSVEGRLYKEVLDCWFYVAPDKRSEPLPPVPPLARSDEEARDA